MNDRGREAYVYIPDEPVGENSRQAVRYTAGDDKDGPDGETYEVDDPAPKELAHRRHEEAADGETQKIRRHAHSRVRLAHTKLGHEARQRAGVAGAEQDHDPGGKGDGRDDPRAVPHRPVLGVVGVIVTKDDFKIGQPVRVGRRRRTTTRRRRDCGRRGCCWQRSGWFVLF